jgi:hypothetical protein
MTMTASWANDHQGESAAILAKYIGVEPAIVKSMRRIAYGEHLDAGEMQGLIDLAARYHAIPASFSATSMIFNDD